MDTRGLVLAVMVLSANVTDAMAGQVLLEDLAADKYPRLRVVWADSAFGKEGLPEWVARERNSVAANRIGHQSCPNGLCHRAFG